MIVGKRQAEKIGMAWVRVFFVTGRILRGDLQEQVPRRRLAEKLFRGGILAVKFDHAPLRATSAFE